MTWQEIHKLDQLVTLEINSSCGASRTVGKRFFARFFTLTGVSFALVRT